MKQIILYIFLIFLTAACESTYTAKDYKDDNPRVGDCEFQRELNYLFEKFPEIGETPSREFICYYTKDYCTFIFSENWPSTIYEMTSCEEY